MVKTVRFTPTAIVSFSTEQGELTIRAEAEKEGLAIDSDIISINTTNDIQSDAGTFQITLVNRNRWDKVLASNDFVRIQMYRHDDKADYKSATVMMGLIDDVRRGVTIQGNTIQRTVTITGRTFAKALINFEVGVVDEVNVTAMSIGWLGDRITFDGSSAGELVQMLFDILIYEYMNYTFKNGQSFKSYSKLRLSSRQGERLRDGSSFINYQGSMQSFVREVVNEPFNQMFWEFYDDGLASFVVRETPFNPDAWNALTTHIIYDEDVVTDSIGRSDIETYTLYSVGIQNYFSSYDTNATLGVYPYWYKPYFEKFGLRRLNRYTGYIGYGNSEDSLATSIQLEAYQRDLYNWNVLNPNFYNGHITVVGQNRYKVGDRLLYLSVESGEEMEFFIESVNHDFQMYGTWITQLGLTRGLPNGGKGRFESPWGGYAKYEGGALGEVGTSVAQNTGSPYSTAYTLPPSILPQGKIASVLEYSKNFVGRTTYSWGGGRTQSDINRGYFDCSSWVHYVFRQNDITLVDASPSNVSTRNLRTAGTAVPSLLSVQPGDLVFFTTTGQIDSHVGIWLGDGKWIGCQSSTGVKIENFQGYWQKLFSGTIRRVVNS